MRGIGGIFWLFWTGGGAPVKTALLDQSVVSGLGNIYVCEALFRAGVSPRRKAGNLGAKRVERLVPHIREVLQEAIAAGGSSLRDFTGAGAQPVISSIILTCMTGKAKPVQTGIVMLQSNVLSNPGDRAFIVQNASVNWHLRKGPAVLTQFIKPFFNFAGFVCGLAMTVVSAAFLSAVPEIPLAPGMQENAESTLIFDKPEGRIIAIEALTDRPTEEILSYYRAGFAQSWLGPVRQGLDPAE